MCYLLVTFTTFNSNANNNVNVNGNNNVNEDYSITDRHNNIAIDF